MPHTPEQMPVTFGGLPPGPRPGRVAVLPVPFEATVSYGKGTAQGPAAIIEASRHLELYDPELQVEPSSVGIDTFDALGPRFAPPDGPQEIVTNAVEAILERGQWLLLLGGEHSLTPSALRAVLRRSSDVGLLQLDAHADLRDTFEGTSWSHACTMRRCLDLTDQVVQVGLRSISKAEVQYLSTSPQNARCFFGRPPDPKVVIDLLPERIYLTLDIDVLDPSIMPATGTPEPNGWSFDELMSFLREIFSHRRVVAADLVEFAPISGFSTPDVVAATLASKLIGYWGFLNHQRS